ncbi:F0F1 ATP synthase subunit B family protein [Aestuariispira ectoiniformans]|uniref:F0F1 ATP synthase subunit B family protein n=1 Tax=Aestuariispira ectoiniformans TaxID=2775080 RepID=UPI00223B60D9|nr:F0F1 ATP synthase subunit B' [Aestuariispira ectoiniformans]
MPQFDPTHFPSQIFWLVVVFTTLFLIMWKFVLPRITEVMEMREERIGADLKRAEEAKAEAEAVLADYEAALAKARAEAQDILRKASDDMAEEQAKRIEKANADIAAKLDEADQRIAEAREKALSHVREMAGEIAEATVERLAGSADRKAVDAALDSVAK